MRLDARVAATNDACTHSAVLDQFRFVRSQPRRLDRLITDVVLSWRVTNVPSRQSRQQSGAVRAAQIVAHFSSVFDSSVTRSTTRRSSRDFNCLMRDGAERWSDGGRRRCWASLSTVTAAVNSTARVK